MKEWRKKGFHLPKFMRDFHDQKDLFKAIDQLVTDIPEEHKISWVDGHVYVIDIFLWFMARHGYTLQKTKAKYDFNDIDYSINWVKEESRNAFADMLETTTSPDEKPNEE